MTGKEKELRNSALVWAYIENNLQKSIDYTVELISRKHLYKLYRYRPPREYEIRTLQQGQIFLCRPYVYEDLGDCSTCFDYEDLYKYTEEELKPYFNIKNSGENIKRSIEIIEQSDLWINLNNKMKNEWAVACFTENPDNEYMWSKYAEDDTGICIEYDIGDILGIAELKQLEFMPVRYVDDRKKQRDIIFSSKDYSEDDNDSCRKYILSCMTKDNVPYNKEAEWRLLSYHGKFESSSAKGDKYDFVNPVRIIVGKNIERNMQFYERVCEYCVRNNIVIERR